MGLRFWGKKKEDKVETPEQKDAYADKIAEIKRKWQESGKGEEIDVNVSELEGEETEQDKEKGKVEGETEIQEIPGPEKTEEEKRVEEKVAKKTNDGVQVKERKLYKLRIVYNKNGCVGAGHCVLSDIDNFKLDKDFKADLIGGKEQEPVKGVYYKEIETYEPHQIINAARTCTPQVIGVIDLETGKRIAP